MKNKIRIYPIFYLLKGDYRVSRSDARELEAAFHQRTAECLELGFQREGLAFNFRGVGYPKIFNPKP